MTKEVLWSGGSHRVDGGGKVIFVEGNIYTNMFIDILKHSRYGKTVNRNIKLEKHACSTIQ